MEQVYDVTIIGAGIVGAALARALTAYDLAVLLLEQERDVAMGSTKANSAIVHGGYAESSDTLKGRLCYQGRRQFPKLERELNFGFHACGSLVVAFHESDLANLHALLDNGLRNGIPPEELELWDRDLLQARVPGIADEALAALYCRGAGICSPYGMAIAMIENALHNGLTLRLGEALTAVTQIGDDLLLETCAGQSYRSRRVVNAAGLGAEAVARLFGIESVSLYGRSGEYILLDRGTDERVPYVLFGMPTKLGKGILLSPTIHGNLIIGPDASDLLDMDAKEAAVRGLDTHEERLLNIWQQGAELVPGLPVSKIIRDFAGVRAASATGDFLIGRDPTGSIKGYYQAAGIQSPGLTASPAIADMLIDLMQEDGLRLMPKAGFDPKRRAYVLPLGSVALRETGESREPLLRAELEVRLKLPPGTPGRMICRCEEVTEEAVLASMRQGMPVQTVDGIKRRSRAGMGRCQGLYCRPRVIEAIHTERGPDSDETGFAVDSEQKGSRRVGAARLRQLIRKRETEAETI